MGRFDKTAIALALALLALVAFKVIGLPFAPLWVGLLGALILVPVLIVWKRK